MSEDVSATVTVPDFVRGDLARLGFELDEAMLRQLGRYLHLLLQANQRMNLTAVREPAAAWRRLILDSLTALPALDDLPAGERVIDVGSGGGMPGLPLAIARPDLKFTLLEATAKKAKCLEEFVHELALANVAVLNARAEQAGKGPPHREAYAVAICRAVGPMRELLEYCLPLVEVGGWVAAMKGPRAEQELEEAPDALTRLGGGPVQVFDAYPEGFELRTVIVVVTKQAATPKHYPRAPGEPRRNPL